MRLNPTNVGKTRAMSPCLNDNWPQGRGGPRTAPPGQSNRSSHSRIVGASLPDYGPIQAMEPRAPAAPNAPLVSVAIPPIPGSMAVVVAHCVRRCGRRFRGRAVDVARTVFGPRRPGPAGSPRSRPGLWRPHACLPQDGWPHRSLRRYRVAP